MFDAANIHINFDTTKIISIYYAKKAQLRKYFSLTGEIFLPNWRKIFS